MKRSLITTAALLLPLLSACGGGATTTPLPLPASGSLSPESKAAEVVRSGAAQTLPQAASAQRLLYVGNTGNNSITVYGASASGNVKPLRTIAGSNTGISNPGQLSQDAQGNLYVANGSSSPPRSHPGILVFAPGASGNVKPIREIAGPATGLDFVEAAAVDPGTGQVLVANREVVGNPVSIRLERFAANASGNVAPLAQSSPAPFPAFQLGFNSSDTHVIEAHLGDPGGEAVLSAGVATYPKLFANGFSLNNEIYGTSWMVTNGVADDPENKTYVTLSGDGSGMYRLAEDTTGNGPDSPGGINLTPPPISIVTSETCGSQIAVSPARDIFVSHKSTACPADAVFVYAPSANGNAAPLRVLAGANTLLNLPDGIFVGK